MHVSTQKPPPSLLTRSSCRSFGTILVRMVDYSASLLKVNNTILMCKCAHGLLEFVKCRQKTHLIAKWIFQMSNHENHLAHFAHCSSVVIFTQSYIFTLQSHVKR